jgi:hypothetical protein
MRRSAPSRARRWLNLSGSQQQISTTAPTDPRGVELLQLSDCSADAPLMLYCEHSSTSDGCPSTLLACCSATGASAVVSVLMAAGQNSGTWTAQFEYRTILLLPIADILNM